MPPPPWTARPPVEGKSYVIWNRRLRRTGWLYFAPRPQWHALVAMGWLRVDVAIEDDPRGKARVKLERIGGEVKN